MPRQRKIIAPTDKKNPFTQQTMTLLMQFSAARKIIIPHSAELAGFIGSAMGQATMKYKQHVAVNAVIEHHNGLVETLKALKDASIEEEDTEDVVNTIQACLDIFDGHMVSFLETNGIKVDKKEDQEGAGNGEAEAEAQG
jgi:hypothetical protein